MKSRILIVAVVVFGLAASAQATTIVYNAEADLRADEGLGTPINPYASVSVGRVGNVWSDGYKSSPTSATFTLLSYFHTEMNNPGWRYDSSGDVPADAVTDQANGYVIGGGWSPVYQNEIILCPSTSLAAVFRWTAPGAGTISVSAVFQTLQNGEAQSVGVAFNNVVLNSGTLAVNGSNVDVSVSNVTVNPGDVLDVYDNANSYGNANWTGAVVSVTFTSSVPEPGTLALLAAGLAGLLCYAWRKRR